MSGFIWLDVVDESGGSIVDATPSTKGVIKLTNDLGGDADHPSVLKINGAAIPASGTLTNGQVLSVSGAAALSYITLDLTNSNTFSGVLPAINLPTASTAVSGIIKLAGDLGGTSISPSVLSIKGATIPTAGSLITGNILQVSGSSSLNYAPLNLAGGVNYITGSLPTANQVTQSLAGDLSGTTNSAAVIKINGTSVASSPSTNQVLVSTSGTTSVWSQIVDGYISSAAAIAATKLAYSDVSSPTLSATTVQSAIDAIKIAAVAPAIQRQSQTVTLANLQALGAVGTGTLNIGAVLPTNARFLGAEINTTQILAGIGLVTALAAVQSTTDTVGSIITGATVLSTGFIGMNGTNQYMSRGGQQLTITVVLTGALFSGLTGGQLTVNLFYAVIV